MAYKAGERVLLPAVCEADKDTLIIADGFSCREQIAQTTDRQALHVAQVIQMAMHEAQNEHVSDYPEKQYVRSPQPAHAALKEVAMLGGGMVGMVLTGGILVWILKKRK